MREARVAMREPSGPSPGGRFASALNAAPSAVAAPERRDDDEADVVAKAAEARRAAMADAEAIARAQQRVFLDKRDAMAARLATKPRHGLFSRVPTYVVLALSWGLVTWTVLAHARAEHLVTGLRAAAHTTRRRSGRRPWPWPWRQRVQGRSARAEQACAKQTRAAAAAAAAAFRCMGAPYGGRRGRGGRGGRCGRAGPGDTGTDARRRAATAAQRRRSGAATASRSVARATGGPAAKV